MQYSTLPCQQYYVLPQDSILATQSFRKGRVFASTSQYTGQIGNECHGIVDLPAGWKREVFRICQSTGQCLKDCIIIKSYKRKTFHNIEAPKPVHAVHYKSFFEPLSEWHGVPYSVDQRMSSKIVHQRWVGASGEEPMWVSEGLWIRVKDGLISYHEDVDFEVVPRAIGLFMVHESSEYGGYPIGDWAGLSYDILTGDLLQALQDYVQAYLAAVQANPMYQRQLHLPKHQQVPVLDPPDPTEDPLDVAGLFNLGSTLWSKFNNMFLNARESLPGPPEAH
ncbi:uncharacterized protein EI90DRAFT_3133013 [Cantharellus anzutake]|uniref:uncharacterized protein n=1 Tax=Cantharellus anzutake TaxID=1750568 RepID=UPI001906DA6E|nr:uncharacterized protein EI90DRAFT_3133013 [Cantharellus anzutake]KAF8318825.1 hypothetical protein EI90DRAFT_3133013 [Cantharellus anzutake]